MIFSGFKKLYESRRIINIFNGFIFNLEKISSFNNFNNQEIDKYYRELKKVDIDNIIKNYNVDLINFSDSKIPIDLLKEKGIKTIYDLQNWDFKQLKSINGIGTIYAKKIIINRDLIIQKADEKTGFIIPEYYDNRYINLLKTLYYRIHCQPVINDLKKIYAKKTLKNHIDKSKVLTGIVRYFLSSNKSRLNAQSSINYLYQLLDDGFSFKANKLINNFNDILSVSNKEVFKDYQNSSADYYAILDNYIPYNANILDELIVKVNKTYLNLDQFNGTLRPYQLFGCKYILFEKNVFLADEMGLGKTIQAIACINHLVQEEKNTILIVVPLSILTNWQKEMKKHLIYKINIVYKTNLHFKENSINITTFETLNKIDFNIIESLDFLIIDEAHYIKNANTIRSKNCKKLIDKSKKVLFMSGTPLENNIEEFQYLVSLLNPEIALEIEKYKSLITVDIFKEKIADVYLRRKREDVLKELPPLIEIQEWCLMNDEEVILYDKLLNEGNFIKLRQFSFLSENSGKITRILEIVEEALLEKRNILIFSYFIDTLYRIYDFIKDNCIGIIEGKLDYKKREELIEKFLKSEGKILLSQINVGGIGINLQNSSVVIICEPQLKPSLENQAVSRAYRMGQNRKVFVHRILMDNTIDEYITEILDNKAFIFEEYVDESAVFKKQMEIKIIKDELKKLAHS